LQQNAPNPRHGTPNSCFGAFWTIPLQHELRCKSGRSGVVNAQVRPTMSRRTFFAMNAPDPAHWSLDSCFAAFGTAPLLHKLRCKSYRIGVINAQVRPTISHRNFLQRTHQIHPIGPESHVLVRFGPFCYMMNSGRKMAELVQVMHRFVQRCRVGCFRNGHTRYTLLETKVKYSGISDHFVTTRNSVQNWQNWCL
jgi:hypothetical protein